MRHYLWMIVLSILSIHCVVAQDLLPLSGDQHYIEWLEEQEESGTRIDARFSLQQVLTIQGDPFVADVDSFERIPHYRENVLRSSRLNEITDGRIEKRLLDSFEIIQENQTTMYDYTWNSAFQDYILEARTDIYQNDNGRDTLLERFVYNGFEDWRPVTRVRSVYNEELLSLFEFYIWDLDNNRYRPNTQLMLIYSGSQLDTVYANIWNTDLELYETISYSRLLYDNNLLTEQIEVNINADGTQSNSRRILIQRNEDNLEVARISEEWDERSSSWLPASRRIRTYVMNSAIAAITIQIWDSQNQEYVNQIREVLTYDFDVEAEDVLQDVFHMPGAAPRPLFKLDAYRDEIFSNGSWNLDTEIQYFYTDKTVTNSEEQITTKSVVYPVPASNALYIDGDFTITDVKMYDLSGNLCDVTVEPGRRSIDISSLTTGTYILRLHTTEGIINEKFIKQ